MTHPCVSPSAFVHSRSLFRASSGRGATVRVTDGGPTAEGRDGRGKFSRSDRATPYFCRKTLFQRARVNICSYSVSVGGGLRGARGINPPSPIFETKTINVCSNQNEIRFFFFDSKLNHYRLVFFGFLKESSLCLTSPCFSFIIKL